MAKKPFYDADEVMRAAKGNWLEVFAYLAPELDEAMNKINKHVTCPVHGTHDKSGKGDGFRLLKFKTPERGYAVCNTCGVYSDGVATLRWLKGWDFYTCISNIAHVVRVEAKEPTKKTSANLRKPVSECVVEDKAAPSENKVNPDVTSSDFAHAALPDDPGYTDFDEIALVPDTQEDDIRAEPVLSALLQPTPERLAQIQEMQNRLAEKAKTFTIDAQAKIDKLWGESMPLSDGLPAPLFKWFKHRGVLLGNVLALGDHLRYHPSLPYFEVNGDGENALVGNFPALIAAVRRLDGSIITLHRTYLSVDGYKAPVQLPRKMMSIPGEHIGGAIQMGGMPQDGVLAVAEGLETALSPMKVYRIPTWSLVNTTFMTMFTPPENVHTLLIFADKDRKEGGLKAAEALQHRMIEKGIKCKIILPNRPLGESKGIDWNDILLKEGIMGFPQWALIQSIIKKTA